MSNTLVVESAIAVGICLICAALASGLTQGLLTIDLMDLMIKSRSGTEIEQKNAKILLPLLDRHHLLICTLMLWNATAMEILPLYLSNLVNEWIALILSVTLLLIVGEILPSAILTGPNQIQIAAMLAPLVYIVLIAFSPIAYPISLALDAIVGKDEPITTYNKLELEQLVKIQHEEITKRLTFGHKDGHGEQNAEDAVNHEEVNMIAGVLNFSNIQVKEKMSREIFSLDVNDKFDLQTLNKIFRSGYSRIPIFDSDPNNVIGLILTKELLFVDLQDEVPIRTFMSLFPRSIAGVKETDTLSEVLKMFQETRTHLAVVFKDKELQEGRSSVSSILFDKESAVEEVLGIITLEDIVECIIGEDIRDETDLDDERLLRHEERDMEIIRLRLLHPAQQSGGNSKTLKLSPQELQVVAAHLRANVQEITAIFGDDQNAISQYVSDCSVVEIEEADLEVRAQENSRNDRSERQNSPKLPTKTVFFKRGDPTNTCILILSGKVEIVAGKEGFKLELGAWAVLGHQALSSGEDQYIPDFSMTMKSSKLRVVCLNKPNRRTRRHTIAPSS